MNNYSEKIAILTGDPNGIGAEITIKALNTLNLPSSKIVLISNSRVINTYGRLNISYEIIDVDYSGKIIPGEISKEAGDFSFKLLQKACEIKPKYIVTAPISKEAMNLAGHNYRGQTEVLEKFLAHNGQKAEMLFVSKDFRILLLTRHISLNKVSETITKEFVLEKVERLRNHFQKKLNINKPSFALCALNPHAGENGIIGFEEESVMTPAVEALRERGINITNPLPADTLFINGIKNYLNGNKLPYDCYIACYHDQGLIPIKSVASEKTVNMTIGLDIIRTSPCHGTAFDIAGKNMANPESMIEAIKTCLY
ncbi:MAG: 4-hydroxythreonine-4-phosphate dehydrogenase PdxA [bacterium]|nr:4-hydroxythreonine-4-phosphate dehydrogenase PdxA [bacterium]